MANKNTKPNPSPPQKSQNNSSTDRLVAVSQQWSGPLPPPAALAQFDNVIPGAAERILAMVEIEQAHRIETKKKALVATINDTRRGTVIGGVLAAFAIAGSVYAAHIGASAAVSIALVGLPILTLITVLIQNRSDRK